MDSKVCEITIGYKNRNRSNKIKISSSECSYRTLLPHFEESMDYCEEFQVLLLNNANMVLGVSKISIGGVAGTIADPKKIFQAALKANACAIIIAHNHPSGTVTPSQTDLKLTEKIIRGGQLLDIRVLDSIVMGSETYYSMADEGDFSFS